MNGTTIKPLPTIGDYKKLVDLLITPETADVEAKVLIDIVLTTANPEDEDSWFRANIVARHAFQKTEAFETAFREFAGMPDGLPSFSPHGVIDICRQQ